MFKFIVCALLTLYSIVLIAQNKKEGSSAFIAIPAVAQKINQAVSLLEVRQLYQQFEKDFPAEKFRQASFLLDQVYIATASKYIAAHDFNILSTIFNISNHVTRWDMLEKIPEKVWFSSAADSIGNKYVLKQDSLFVSEASLPYIEYLFFTNGHDRALKYIHKVDPQGKGKKLHPILYAHVFAKNGIYDEAVQLLSDLIRSGKSDRYTKEMLERIWYQSGQDSESYANYYNSLLQDLEKEVGKELLKTEIRIKAPDFELMNLDGEVVSLKDLKGKVLVIDFWATWCGPCVASFPAMQRVENHYRSNSDVVFLFVNTMEKEILLSDHLQRIKDFKTAKQLQFSVLMDKSNGGKYEMASAFRVNSIPAKFVVDRDGYIRFANNGFKGSDDALIRELGFLIDYTLGLDKEEYIQKK